MSDHDRLEILRDVIEECYAVALSIRAGIGEFKDIDLETRMLMTTGAEHCVKRLTQLFDDVRDDER